jgi:two-component system response regulator HydG
MVVDDDVVVHHAFASILDQEGYRVVVHERAEAALAALAEQVPDVLLLDLHLPGMGGLEALRAVLARQPHLPVVMVTAEAGVETVVEAMRLGAYDYLTKPLSQASLLTTVRNAMERRRLQLRLADLERAAVGGGYRGIIGRSQAMRDVFRELDRVAPSDVPVLITGESGTGKELVARALHASGPRAVGPLEVVNCAAIPENLQESELFGHERGAFTGAVNRRVGRFERADGGTLFLDELGDLAPEAQAKLLRAVQERRIQRVGGVEEIATDFRLVAATHRELESMVAAGTFREDLFFRVAVFEVEVPPLRRRRDDIPLLARHFVDRFHRSESPAPVLTPAALELLQRYDWPGNVRELQNAIQRALVTCPGEIRVQDLPVRVREVGVRESARAPSAGDGRPRQPPETAPPGAPGAAGPAGAPPEGARAVDPSPPASYRLEDAERAAVLRAVAAAEGNLSEAARLLEIGRTTLYRKLDGWGLR